MVKHCDSLNNETSTTININVDSTLMTGEVYDINFSTLMVLEVYDSLNIEGRGLSLPDFIAVLPSDKQSVSQGKIGLFLLDQ